MAHRIRMNRRALVALGVVAVVGAVGCSGSGSKTRTGAVAGNIGPAASGAAAPASMGVGAKPWTGTVTTAYAWEHVDNGPDDDFFVGRGTKLMRSVDGSIAYSELEPTADRADHDITDAAVKMTREYSALVAGGGNARVYAECIKDGNILRDWQDRTYSWTAGGRDNAAASAMNSRSLLITDHYDPGTEELRHTSITPTGLRVVATTGKVCDDPNELELEEGRYSPAYITSIDGSMEEAVMPDNDPDPDRLVGTLELTSPPYADLAAHFGSYRYTISYDLSREPLSCADEPGRDPVRCYAPLIHIHPDDDHLPMSAAEFIAGSRLKWSKNNCPDKDDFDSTTPDPARLGSGGYVYDPARELCDGTTQRPFSSNELTRPRMPLCAGETGEGTCKSSALGAANEGFFLDPTSDAEARGMLNGASGEQIEAGEVPAYYQYEPRRYIAYWFFWPYSVPATGAAGAVGMAHQGDWEHIVVRLDAANEATAVEYFYHHWALTVPWNHVQVVDDTHPVVLAAEEGHGSYPGDMHAAARHATEVTEAGARIGGTVPGSGVDGRADCNFSSTHHDGPISQSFDRCSSEGPAWATWKNLRDATREPWYGFGGAWGRVGMLKDTTGPPAPHPQIVPTRH